MSKTSKMHYHPHTLYKLQQTAAHNCTVSVINKLYNYVTGYYSKLIFRKLQSKQQNVNNHETKRYQSLLLCLDSFVKQNNYYYMYYTL